MALISRSLHAESVTAVSEATAMAMVSHDTLVVHGQSLADRVFPAAPSVVTVVDLEEERGGADLAELLARVAGLQIRRYGGIGAQAVPSIRGSSGAQVQVMVDGLPLTDAQNGAVDISLLPLERYASAEVHRGLVPAGFGGIGAAGAVNLKTRDHGAGAGVRLFAGSYGDLGGRLSLGLGQGRDAWRGLVLVHGRRIDNDFEYLNDNNTPHNPDDDEKEIRENADFEEWGFFGQVEGEGKAGLVRATLGTFRRDGGRAGPLSYPSPDARVRHQRQDGRLGWTTPGRTFTADLTLAQSEDHLFDPEGQVQRAVKGTTRTENQDILGRLIWTPSWEWTNTGLDLTAGADWRGQQHQEDLPNRSQPQRSRQTATVFAGAALNLYGPRVVLHPAGRWQWFRDDFPPVPALPHLPEEEDVVHEQESFSPSVSLAWEAVARYLTVEAHWHETVRQPTWVELFGQPGGLVGNRELIPEELRGKDLGMRLTHPGWNAALRLTAFEQRTDKTIIWTEHSMQTSRPANIGSTRTRGLEIEAVGQTGPMELVLNVTRQEALDQGDDPIYYGKKLPYLSDWEVYADLRAQLGAWRPGLAVIYESESYRDRYNQDDKLAPDRTLLNLALAHTWQDGIWGKNHEATVTIEVLNATDNVVYDVERYPLPGRSWRLAFHWH